jgi:uncharacterized protein (TIGR03437 family)
MADSGAPSLRGEGYTELLPEIVFTCSGGTPTPAGQEVPLVNIWLTLTGPNSTPMAITTPLVPFQGFNDFSGAALLIDEPPTGKQVLCGSPAWPFVPIQTGATQSDYFGHCQAIAPNGDGTGTYDPDRGPGRGNVLLGRQRGLNSLVWLGVPIDPPGTARVRTLRITNVRMNAAQLNVTPGASIPVTAFLQVERIAPPAPPVPVTKPQQTVAFVQTGLTSDLRKAATYDRQTSLLQCTGDTGTPRLSDLRFLEGFPSSFKTRIAETGSLSVRTMPDPQRFPVQTPIADTGTRLRAGFNNIPPGGTLFVSVNPVAGSTASARLMNGTPSSVVNGVSYAEIPVVNGSGTAVWEITASDPSILDTVNVNAYLNFAAGPETGTSSVRGEFDPFLFAGVDRYNRPIYRPVPAYLPTDYVDDPARGAPAAFTVKDCNTSGLIPRAAVTSGALPVNYRQQGNRVNDFAFYFLSNGDPITNVQAGAPNVSWLTLEPNTSTTPVTFRIHVNPTGLAPGSYTGSFRVTGNGIPAANFTVPLTVTPPGPHLPPGGCTNAGSYSPLAAGSLVMTCFGERFNSENLTKTAPAAEERLSTVIAGTRVLFDGVPATMIYATPNQVGAIAPSSLAGKSFTNVVVENQGDKSPPVTVPVVPLNPALLTADSSGFAKAAALNEDNSYNSVIGALPGQYVVLFGIGGPETDPPGSDGEVTPAAAPFKGPVKVLLGGKEVPASDLAYAGAAPGLFKGVFQINVRLAADAPRNQELQVQVLFGDVGTQPGVTISVR